jgi:calcium-dependent protein kinase
LQSTKTKRGGRRLSDSATLVTTGKRQPQGRQGKRLSLSEYRKADESSAVRLTDSDPNQCIHTAYDLTESPQCRILGHGSSSTVRLAVRRSDATLVAVKCLSKFEIMSSRRAGGGRESTRTSPVRQHHRRPLGPLLGGGGRRSHRRLDECEVLRALDGVPNVTHLLDVYEDDDEVQLVLEYCPGGELFDAIHRRRQLAAAAAQDYGGKRSSRSKSVGSGYTEREAAVIVGQLLEALAALHERGVVHRDVKPENVFLMSTTSTTSNDANANDLEVRLSDFGLARYLHRPSHQRVDADDDASSSSTASSSASGGESPITPQSVLRAQRGRAYSSVGSDFYAAPEVENGSGYDTQCDVYSLGVTLYILLGGFPPRQRKQRAGSLDAYDAILSMLESRTSSSSEGDSSSGSSSGEEEDAEGTNPISVTFPGSHWKHASSGAKDLIRQMMHSDPNVRITARDALQHEWIVQHFEPTAAAKTASTTAEEQPSRAPGQKKRSSLVLSSASIAPCDSDDRPNFRRKLSNLKLCDMASDEGTPDPSPVSNTAAAPPTVAATMPPPMSFGQAAFSMAELYNRMSLVADATIDEVNVDEDIVEDEGMDANAASTPERAVTTTATVPLSV